MKTYKERLIENIDAIGIAHTQMMTILKEDIDLEKVKEDKWKAIAEGKGKAQEVADRLLIELKKKQLELDELNKPKKKSDSKEITEEEEDKTTDFPLEKHLKR